jgi:FixJ family two-component response regulator
MGEGDAPIVSEREEIVSVVDDDASLRRSVRNLLTSVGFRVEAFASAEEFLGSPQSANTGCLVLDLRMTGMNGLELLKHLQANGSTIAVVVLTAHGDEEARRRALEAGAVAFLGKPFRGDALLDAVRTAMSG